MKNPIAFFKWIRKKNYIQQSYSGRYAFVGIGNHSINNLYPALDYLHVPLKYMVTRTFRTADWVSRNYRTVMATNDYDQALEDPEIKGIFICANPNDHYSLAKRALQKGKHVFVEKPLCLSKQELSDIQNIVRETGLTCVVGLQKRYSTCVQLLKEKLPREQIISYHYIFGVGGYPEGNIFWDLFIHPVDLIYFLFGAYEIVSFQKVEQKKGLCTLLMQVKHKNCIGSIEISTEYSWNHPIEVLTVNTQKGIYSMTNHTQLTFTSKPQNLFSIPLEKILDIKQTTECLFDANNFLPVVQNNPLVSQGYLKELKAFVDLCENKKAKNLSAPETLTHTYSILEKLQK